MNAKEIEPGLLLLGKAGEVREVVEMEYPWCWYVTHGTTHSPLKIGCHGLAHWAVRDITECGV